MICHCMKCEQLPDGVYLDYGDNSGPAWVLVIQKEATEADLEENHYLEMEGDVYSSPARDGLFRFSIFCCS